MYIGLPNLVIILRIKYGVSAYWGVRLNKEQKWECLMAEVGGEFLLLTVNLCDGQRGLFSFFNRDQE